MKQPGGSLQKVDSSIKSRVLYFLLGCAIGLAVGMPLAYLSVQDQRRATETLDFLIEQWTAQRETIDTIFIAQFPARIELPDARTGYFPDTVKALAQRLESIYKIPKAVTLAQFALESRWGLSNLNASNYFGHTWVAVKPYLRDTTEWVTRNEKVFRDGKIVSGPPMRFASYRNISECFDVHGLYLSRSPRYANALKMKNSEDFARELSKAGYATDPDYALKLIAIIRRYNLETL